MEQMKIKQKVDASMRRIHLVTWVLPYPLIRNIYNENRLSLVLLAALTVAAHELVYTTCRIYELRLTSVEGVRRARDFKLYNGISFAFKFNRISGLAG